MLRDALEQSLVSAVDTVESSERHARSALGAGREFAVCFGDLLRQLHPVECVGTG